MKELEALITNEKNKLDKVNIVDMKFANKNKAARPPSGRIKI